MLKTTSHIALALFLALVPAAAVAQDQEPAQQPPAQNQPSTETPPPAENQPSSEQPSLVPQESVTESKEAKPAPIKGQIVLQEDNTILASGLMGATVYSAGGEEIGQINDIIVNTSGAVDGVVIGVGGFIGIGQKDVAVEMKAIKLVPSQDLSGATLTIDATAEELQAAPQFKTAALQKLEEENAKLQREMQSAPGGQSQPAPQTQTQ
jgi:sporulation protein YlmC with PRC-barrel domain